MSRTLKLARKSLTNHAIMLVALLLFAAMPMVLNSVFLFTSAYKSYEYSIFIFIWLQLLWILAISTELNVLSIKKYALIVGCIALILVIFSFALIYWVWPVHLRADQSELVRVFLVLGLCALFTLAALIADRISSTIFGRIGAFIGVLNWPYFLFLFSARLRKAIDREMVLENRTPD